MSERQSDAEFRVTTAACSPAGIVHTAAAMLAATRLAFAEAGLPDASLEARLLVRHALGRDAVSLLTRPDEPVGAEEARALADLVQRRLNGEPVARLLGRAEFWGLPFSLSPATLVPRPDSETVVQAGLAHPAAAPAILDLGTGSGCLLVALLHERPGAWALGVDRSEEAVRAARANARANGVGERAHFAVSDWARPIGRTFDLVVSNPPYIVSAAIPGLDREVREHDPAGALDGGPDGLACYRILLDAAAGLLAPGGLGVFEIGFDQGDAVSGLVRSAGLVPGEVRRDLAGNDRVVTFRRTGDFAGT